MHTNSLSYLPESLINLANRVGARLSSRLVNGSYYYDGYSIGTQVRRPSGEVTPFEHHDVLHEVGHYFFASNEQRRFPEFGLTGAVLPDCVRFDAPLIVSWNEADFQERCTQAFCIIVGRALNLSPRLWSAPNWEPSASWDSYLEYKDAQGEGHFETYIELAQEMINRSRIL